LGVPFQKVAPKPQNKYTILHSSEPAEKAYKSDFDWCLKFGEILVGKILLEIINTQTATYTKVSSHCAHT